MWMSRSHFLVLANFFGTSPFLRVTAPGGGLMLDRLVIVLLLGLLWVSVYVNYSLGRDLRRVCELTGPHDAVFGSLRTPREEVGNICLHRDPEY
jgi:hypothetical protein